MQEGVLPLHTVGGVFNSRLWRFFCLLLFMLVLTGISCNTANVSIAIEFSTSVVLLRIGSGHSGTSFVTDGNPNINVSFAVNSVEIKISIDSRLTPVENYTFTAPHADFVQIATLLTNGIDDTVSVEFDMGGGNSLVYGPDNESFFKDNMAMNFIGVGPDFASYQIDFIRFSIKELTYTADPPNLYIGWDSPCWEVWGSIPDTSTTTTTTTTTTTAADASGMTGFVILATMLTLIMLRKREKR
ncbi:MAG: hypothetical protein ACFFDT_04840 [Candidatus Hodarchaeota archaeon]